MELARLALFTPIQMKIKQNVFQITVHQYRYYFKMELVKPVQDIRELMRLEKPASKKTARLIEK